MLISLLFITCVHVCVCVISWMQVKIKKKMHLDKKDLEPVITDDDMKNASQTDGASLVQLLCLVDSFFFFLSLFFSFK